MKYNHGNYAIYEGHIIRLEVLDLLNIQAAALEGIYPYQPVRITGELLERLGFVKTAYNKYVLGAYAVINGISMWAFVQVRTGIHIRWVEYLHEVQNLFTALGEKELAFTETPENP